jgi:carbonic anhydrase
LVLGHTACGAKKGAIDDVVLGNLTGLLARVKPAIRKLSLKARSPGRNRLTSALSPEPMSNWQSKAFGGEALYWRIEKNGSIQITGAMYSVANGVVDFVS